MEFYLIALNINVEQTVPFVVRKTYRDTIKLRFLLHQLNTLFFFRNGNYFFKYNFFMIDALEADKAITVSSKVPLDQDAVTYVANGSPLTDFTKRGRMVHEL